MSRRLLWIVPKWPLPPEDGARLATTNLLRGLTSLGEEIDLIAIAGVDEATDAEAARRVLGVRQVMIIHRSNPRGVARLIGFAQAILTQPDTPLTMLPYAAAGVRSRFRADLSGAGATWDAVVYDGLHPAAHAIRRGVYDAAIRPAARVIYRAHNREADLWDRKVELCSRRLEKILLAAQARRVRRFEDSLVEAAVGLATVSPDDLGAFRQTAAVSAVVPIGYEFGSTPPPLPAADSTTKILFLGRLDWYPNRDGLRWFLENVWSAVAAARPDLRLIIAGAGDSAWLAPYVERFRDTIDFRGRVAAVEPLYRESALAIVPVFYGSGTRVKVIEASRYGRPCLSTALGVEGTGLVANTSYLRAEETADWIRLLDQTTHEVCARVGLEAYQALKATFEVAAAARRFKDLVDSVLGH